MRQHLLDLWAIVERLPVPLPEVSPYTSDHGRRGGEESL